MESNTRNGKTESTDVDVDITDENEITRSNGLTKEALRRLQLHPVRERYVTYLYARTEIDGREVAVKLSETSYDETPPEVDISSIEKAIIDEYEKIVEKELKKQNNEHPLS